MYDTATKIIRTRIKSEIIDKDSTPVIGANLPPPNRVDLDDRMFAEISWRGHQEGGHIEFGGAADTYEEGVSLFVLISSPEEGEKDILVYARKFINAFRKFVSTDSGVTVECNPPPRLISDGPQRVNGKYQVTVLCPFKVKETV